MIRWILGGLLVLAAGFWLLLHPEKWEWLAALQERVQKWKPRTAKGIVISIVILILLAAVLYLLGLPDWVFLAAALILLAAEMTMFLLYYRCPKCGRVQSPASRHCYYCGEALPWDEQDRRNL